MAIKKIVLFLVIAFGITAFVVSTGNSSNNSAPNFECILCHEGAGSSEINVEGLPKKYTPGKTYKMILMVKGDVESLGDVAGGFAIEASAGELINIDKKNTQLSEGILTHTKEGSGLREWTFGWKAPSEKAEVTLSVMAVAANGDFSVIGDLVGADGYTIMPGK